MNYRYYYEDCPPGSEMTLAPRTVTAEEIVGFASRFDPVPFHLDEEAGRASLLGGLAAMVGLAFVAERGIRAIIRRRRKDDDA